MIHMEQKHKKILWDILQKYAYTFHAFGSRVTGKHTKFSDLDIFVDSDINIKDTINLKDDLSLSDLPFSVDIVEKRYCKKDFIDLIKKDFTKINQKTLELS